MSLARKPRAGSTGSPRSLNRRPALSSDQRDVVGNSRSVNWCWTRRRPLETFHCRGSSSGTRAVFRAERVGLGQTVSTGRCGHRAGTAVSSGARGCTFRRRAEPHRSRTHGAACARSTTICSACPDAPRPQAPRRSDGAACSKISGRVANRRRASAWGGPDKGGPSSDFVGIAGAGGEAQPFASPRRRRGAPNHTLPVARLGCLDGGPRARR